MKLLTIVGTRPEAVKMAPVLLQLRDRPELLSLLCHTGQHDGMFEETLSFFGLSADFSLGLMEAGQSLNRFASRALTGIDALLRAERPDRVVVHGDTGTAVAAAQAAANLDIPVAHVEAGLRTYDARRPWPEENNRRIVDALAGLLFAPTPRAAANLAAERAEGLIHVTGNSSIDAVHMVLAALERDPLLCARYDAMVPAGGERPLILATAHRRESIGGGLADIGAALRLIAASGVAEIALPLHPNPDVQAELLPIAADTPGIHLLPPLPLPAMLRLMQRAALVLTDSGGVQEEGAALAKPVLVMRETTERPEGVQLGIARLVGTDPDRILAETEAALDRVHPWGAANPYGDGRAAGRIAAGLAGIAFEPFVPAPSPEIRTQLVAVPAAARSM